MNSKIKSIQYTKGCAEFETTLHIRIECTIENKVFQKGKFFNGETADNMWNTWDSTTEPQIIEAVLNS